jgi:LEA14-like dessication related protein
MRKILLVSGVSLLVLGASFYIKTQIDLAKSFCTKTKGFRLLKIGIDNVSILFDFVIKNKADVGIKILETNIDVYANGVFISNILQQNLAEIKPRGEAVFTVKTDFNPSKIVSDLKTIFTSSSLNNIVIEFKGKLKVKKFGITFSVPVNYKTNYKELTAPSTSEC